MGKGINKIPSRYSNNVEEKRLGTFCCNMRINKKQNKLALDKINKLELLDGCYWTK